MITAESAGTAEGESVLPVLEDVLSVGGFTRAAKSVRNEEIGRNPSSADFAIFAVKGQHESRSERNESCGDGSLG